jgi:hypothetical protein
MTLTVATPDGRELSYLHSHDVTYVTFCEGPYGESVAYRDFMGWDVPWYSAEDSADAPLAGRWFGMQVCYLRRGGQVFETGQQPAKITGLRYISRSRVRRQGLEP